MPERIKSDRNVYEVDAWNESSGGFFAIAQCITTGKKVFIKKYTSLQQPVMGPGITPATYEKRTKRFEKYVANRREINNRLRKVAGEGGNIVAPIEEFVFDRRFYDVTEYVIFTKLTPADIAKMSDEDRLLFLKTAVYALKTVHEICKIIHIDIKDANLMAVKNARNKLVAKLIDFDSSLMADAPLPKSTGGDLTYMSPELALYLGSEGDPDLGKKVSIKTDIFSLGLAFHYYLSGNLPTYRNVNDPIVLDNMEKGNVVSPCEVLNGGGELVVSPDIEEPYHSLILDMLQKDPDKRPDSREVFDRLTKTVTLFEDPWPVDKIRYERYKILEKYKGGIKRGTKQGKYELLNERGKCAAEYDRTGLISAGFAKSTELPPPVFDDPWPSDKIEWNKQNMHKILMFSRGIMRASSEGKYHFINRSGKPEERELDCKYLIDHGYASPTTPPPPVFDEPWPSDNIEWNKDRINRFYKGIIRASSEGKYKLVDGSGKTGSREVDRTWLITQEYASATTPREVFEDPWPGDNIQWNKKTILVFYSGIKRASAAGNYILFDKRGKQAKEMDLERLLLLEYAIPL